MVAYFSFVMLASWYVCMFQCAPYFDASGCQHPGCEPLYPTPDCIQACKDNTDYQTVKHYASSAYRVGSDPYDIMAEIYTNGPVEVSFQVYEVNHGYHHNENVH